MKRLIAAVLVLAGILTGAAELPALASTSSGVPVSHITRGQHTCSYTSPEYMASDWDMDVHTRPGTAYLHADHTAGGWYEDAYWVTGYHDENSSICNRRQIRRGVYGRSWALPLRVRELPLITADFLATGSGRLGFDIWLTADPHEIGPHQWEHDPRTWEILLQPVQHGSQIRFGGPRWHRRYLSILPVHHGAVDVRALDITRIIRDLGVRYFYYRA